MAPASEPFHRLGRENLGEVLARDEQRGDRLGAAGHREARARRGSVEVIAPADHAEGTHDAELDVDDVRVTAR